MPKRFDDDEDSQEGLKAAPKPKTARKRKAMILEDSDQSNEQFPPLQYDTKPKKSTKKTATPKKASSKKTNEGDSKTSGKSISSYFMALQREPPKKLGSRPLPRGKDDCLEGLTFVITGILDSIERDDAANLIKRHGGKVTTSVSGKTSFVVLGRDAGPAKLEKIKKFNTKTIDDEGLYRMIEAHPIDQPSEQKQAPTSDDIKPEPQPKKVLITSLADGKEKPPNLKPAAPAYDTKSSVVENNGAPQSLQTSSTTLWVDKYKPTSVKNLVGQQGASSPANKLLAWLKNWGSPGLKKSAASAKDDGSQYKAVLLSGKPGVGKTTTAILCCKQLELDYIELNASDTRNSSLMKNTIRESAKGGSCFFFARNQPRTDVNKATHVIIMDEVDGISGNQDRGGLTELVATIKNTRVPIICICNDRSSQKIRSLANHCFDLRFQRPRVEQIKAFCSTIAFKENLTIQPQALTEIIAGADQDIRQVVNRLQMWSTTKSSLNFDQVMDENKYSYKDSSQSVFEAVRKLLSSSESHKMTTNDKMDQFFVDYSIMPLFMQDNYALVQPINAGNASQPSSKPKSLKQKTLDTYAEVCDLMALSTIADRTIRSKQAWNLLPVQGMLSCVLPSDLVNGHIQGMINFPQWLGKNSTHGKNERFLDQLSLHTRVSTHSNRKDLILDILPFVYRHMMENLTSPNCVEDGSLESAVQLMQGYNLTREDWDLIRELQAYDLPATAGRSGLSSTKIPTKVLTAFTRSLNKVKRVLPYSQSKPNKKSVKAVAEELLKLNIEGNEEQVESDEGSSEEQPTPLPVSNDTKVVARKRANTSASKGRAAKKSKVI